MARDHIRSAITEQLAPMLASAGFRRTQPKHFMSVSGDLVRHVGFQLSQWGGQSFCLHLYVNTLLNPLGSLHGYRVGRRLQNDPDSSVPWEGATEEAARAAIASVASVLRSGHLSWLTSVATLRDYAFEYVSDPQSTADDFELALVLAREGQSDRPWWSAEKILRAKPELEESEYARSLRSRATLLQAAIKSNAVGQLIESWRTEYIDRNKLTAVAG
jgi:hypothetical protein